MTANNKRIYKIFLLTVILVGYLLGAIAIFNLKTILGIGYYEGTKEFTTPVNDGSGGLEVNMYVQHRSYLYHDFGYTITALSRGDVEVVGISYGNYRLRTGGALQQIVDSNFTTPRKSISYEDFSVIQAEENYTITGYIDVIFSINSINETHRIAIDLGIIVELNGDQINYEWGNFSIWLNVIYLSFTAIPLFLLYRNIKMLKFEKWYSEELKDRDQNFFKILSNKSEE
ncbi:MAG: hypothetical protein EU532_14800 [Promethearchaeota archaeon]|nr:MAG: hypothetical protein EU532_14800 [Candidatus Lokiarchaeota archaeon]